MPMTAGTTFRKKRCPAGCGRSIARNTLKKHLNSAHPGFLQNHDSRSAILHSTRTHLDVLKEAVHTAINNHNWKGASDMLDIIQVIDAGKPIEAGE